MKLEDVKREWNAQADEHNQWCDISGEEMVEFALELMGKLRCGTCRYLKQYSTIVGRNRSIYFCELQQFDATVHGHDAPDNFGCINWKEK